MAIAKKIFGFVKEFMVAIFDLVLFLTGICTMLQWDEEPLCFHLGFALILTGLGVALLPAVTCGSAEVP